MCQSIVPALAVPQGQSSPCRAAGQPKKNAPSQFSATLSLKRSTLHPTHYPPSPQP